MPSRRNHMAAGGAVATAVVMLYDDSFAAAHNHVDWARWDEKLEAANCSANYSTALSASSRMGDNGTWITSPRCFGMQLEFLSIAGCKYFAQVDCAARCDASMQHEVVSSGGGGGTGAGGGTDDAFGNAEFSYCGLFCRNREAVHPPGGNGTELLGCAHPKNATQCNCALAACNGTTTPAAVGSDGDGDGDAEGPGWCDLYCDKVADSCAVEADASGCGRAEAKAALGGSLVNVSRVLEFSFPVGIAASASGVVPSMDSACSAADDACGTGTAASGAAGGGCNVTDLEYTDMGTAAAAVSGLVTGLIDGALDGLLPALVDDPPAMPTVMLRPQLNMLCLGAFGDLFTAEMETADPFGAVQEAIAGYYDCQDRSSTWCLNHADKCTWDEDRSECLQGADRDTARLHAATTVAPVGSTQGPRAAGGQETVITVVAVVCACLVVAVVAIVAVVCSRRCSGARKAGELKRTVTQSQVQPAPKLRDDDKGPAKLRTRSQRTALSDNEEQLLRSVTVESSKKKYPDAAKEEPAKRQSRKSKKRHKKKAAKNKREEAAAAATTQAATEAGAESRSDGSNGDGDGGEQGSSSGPSSRAAHRALLRKASTERAAAAAAAVGNADESAM